MLVTLYLAKIPSNRVCRGEEAESLIETQPPERQSVVVRLSEPGETEDFVAEVLDGLYIREDVTHHRTGLQAVPHHGGKTANAAMLYDWAKPRTVLVSQRMPAPGTADALTPVERRGIPFLRTWKRGAVHFRWSSDHIITEGFMDEQD